MLSQMHKNNHRFKFNVFERLMHKWPGEARFGMYRFLPVFFALGALYEFTLINLTVGQVNFCKFVFVLYMIVLCYCQGGALFYTTSIYFL